MERRTKRFLTSGRRRAEERARSPRRPADPAPSAPAAPGLKAGRGASADRYPVRDFSRLVGMKGFSEPMLRNHFELYQGYVKNANRLLEEFEAHARNGTLDSPSFAELKRRFGWEYNGVRLHELYFENLSKTPSPLDGGSDLHARLTADFGSYEKWAAEFRALGAMRGIGWVVLCHDPLRNRLVNAWVDQHDVGHLAGGSPVLVLDVFEHAYTLDYGIKKADYIDAFFGAIPWDAVARRL
jgi:Fe-Mn family superoxide dismutase